MDTKHFFKRTKTCEAKYGDDEAVKFVIFSTTNGLFLGVVVYVYGQLKGGDKNKTIDVKHFPAETEQKAIESCEKWIKDNINDQITINCIDGVES